MKPPIITLLTDFGSQDYFVGAMKGVILSINPEARIVDITHEIPPQDIRAAAFNLLACYKFFPAGTIHVAVVDPGVGSARRPLVIESGGQLFVGPDNGIFSWVCEREGDYRCIHLTNDKFFHHPVSATFHGRDIFAPVAAALSKGVPDSEIGVPVDDPVQLERIRSRSVEINAVEGHIIHIDRFGNCITNLTRADFSNGARLIINNREITSFRDFFAAGNDEAGELFCILGSAGFLEVAARNAGAARFLNAFVGQRVKLIRSAKK